MLVLEVGHRRYQTTVTLFSSEPQCPPPPPPQGAVAFTASNYRLYQSDISPYISTGLNRHLKGTADSIVAGPCTTPEGEKQVGSIAKHSARILVPTRVQTACIACIPLPPSHWDSSHCCVITLVIRRHKEERNIFSSRLVFCVCVTPAMKVNRYRSLMSLWRTMKLN